MAVAYLQGGAQTTVTATMTELFPALWFNTKNKKLLTRIQLDDMVQNYIRALLDFDGTVKQASGTIIKTKMGKIYYYNGKKISKNEWDLVPDGPRKFYGIY